MPANVYPAAVRHSAPPARPRPLHVVGGAILDGDRCLVARRGPRMSLAGRFEFPGGKLEPREAPEAALARELAEELGIEVRVGERLGRSETRLRGRPLHLDVHAVRWTGGRLQLREHAEVRWVSAGELDRLDWAEADVPVLPAVRARLRDDPAAQRVPGDVSFVAADWSREPRKRAVCVARRGSGWCLRRHEPPPQGWHLEELLRLAGGLQDETGRAVVLGIDAVLGVPAVVARAAGCPGFLAYLERLRAGGGLDAECARPAAWSAARPFFRVPAGRGGLSGFVHAAGGRSGLLRQIELRAGAKPVFVLSGIPGSVGSGSRALWRELLPLPARRDRALRIWPFEGSLAALAGSGAVVLAEMYPRAAYAVALADRLPAPPRALAKTRRDVRAEALGRLDRASWPREHGVDLGSLAAARASEDDFDALLTAAALVRLAVEGRPLSGELVDPCAEGGILGVS